MYGVVASGFIPDEYMIMCFFVPGERGRYILCWNTRPPINEGATIMDNFETGAEYKTWGRSRVSRLPDYDYADDRPVHLTLCALDKK